MRGYEIKDGESVHLKHPELFHYTNWNGLHGIWTSQNLWLNHYLSMNDSSEINHFKGILSNEVQKRFLSRVIRRCRLSARYSRDVAKLGGPKKASQLKANEFSNEFFKISFGQNRDDDACYAPYICSFCSHSYDKQYEIENGLLSQWRAYGKDSPYCIVFDTVEMKKILAAEANKFAFAYWIIRDVTYTLDGYTISPELESAIDKILNFSIHGFPTNRDTASFDQSIGSLLSAFMTTKHQGFHEEREVRIVISPLPKHLYLSDAKNKSSDINGRQHKEHMYHQKHTNSRRYIELIGGHDTEKSLPIKRIIVGPGQNQLAAKQRAEQLVGQKVDIVISKTPYVLQAG